MPGDNPRVTWRCARTIPHSALAVLLVGGCYRSTPRDEELRDPLRRSELPVTYGVGTTAPDGAARRAARPRDYWTRLDWIDVR